MVRRKYYTFGLNNPAQSFSWYECQECALIAVDLILDEYWLWLHDTERKEYWNEVKKEIEKL